MTELSSADEPTRAEPRETLVHYVAHESRLALRLIVLVLLGVTVVTMATFWFWAIIPAMILLGAYLMLVTMGLVEHLTEQPGAEDARREAELAEDAAPAERVVETVQEEESRIIVTAVEHRRTVLTTEILVAAGIAAFTIAAVFLPLKLFAIGSLVLFGYIILVLAPVWLGLIEDDLEHERDRVEHDLHTV